ncbi:MAG: hypothetical protein WC497_02675 [Patescibacteria group bacterium]
MTSKQKISEALKEDWYIQGFNAVPAFITPSAWSGFALMAQEGFGYTKFFFIFRTNTAKCITGRRIWRAFGR